MMKWLMRGRYDYVLSSRGFVDLKIDTPIERVVELDSGIMYIVLDKNYGQWDGSVFVDNPKKVLNKQRVRRKLIRRVPCDCPNVGWNYTEWNAGVPLYCKTIQCPLIGKNYIDGSLLYRCDFRGAKANDYREFAAQNGKEIQYVEILL